MSRVGGGRYYDDRESDYYSNVGRGEREREYEEVEYRAQRRGPERERERVVEKERVVVDERVRPRERDLGPEILREDYGRTSAGPMVLRAREREEIEYRPRERPREVVREEIIERVPLPEPRREVVEERVEREEVVRRPERERERDWEREEVIVRRGGGERDFDDRGSRGGRGFDSREEIDIRRVESNVGRPREYERDVREEDVIIRQNTRERPREVDRGFERDEVIIRRGEMDRPREVERDELIVRRGEVDRPREVDRSFERDEVIIRRGEMDRPREVERDEVILRRGEVDRPREADRGFERDEVIIRRGETDRPREVPRDFERDDITISRRAERDRLREVSRDFERDDITISRRAEKDRPREVSRDFERDDITISRRAEKDRPREVSRDFERDDITISRRAERDRPREYEREYERGREFGRSRPVSRERSRGDERDREEIIIRRDEVDGGRGRGEASRDEIIIRRDKERSISPSTTVAVPEPPIVRAPPIHQEIITHHRHIEHGYEVIPPPMVVPSRARTPQPPPAPIAPPREEVSESIEINRRGERDGRAYDEDIDITINRETSRRPTRGDELAIRPREPTPDFGPRRGGYRDPRDERDIREEAAYYARRNNERAYIGEAYNGATQDWGTVDVPPGTKRVTMDGAGGASEEISWQRYNGVRTSQLNVDGEEYGRGMEVGRPHAGGGDIIGRRYEGVKDPRDRLWTEITKDLVSKEALTKAGYEFEETELFYYVFSYMNYDDVSRLVDLSADLRASRRDRVAQLEWEQRDPRLRLEAVPAIPERERLMLGPPPRAGAWEDETIVREREVSYDRRPVVLDEVMREREVIYDRRPTGPPPGRYY